jgi:pilus assembly protein CpaB
MSIRTVLVLLLSVICGVSAAVGVNVLGGKQEPVVVAAKTVPVVVAAVDVARGTALGEAHVVTRDWPEENLPPGVVTDLSQAVGRPVLTQLFVGEPLLESKLSEVGLLGAAALVRPNMRGFTIHTPTDSAGVAGFVLPGNRVDILLTISNRDDDGVTGGGVTSTLLQNVEVLAAGNRLDPNQEKGKSSQFRSVTLHVTPQDAATLTAAQSKGSLNLTLRNDTDESMADTRPVMVRDLMFKEEVAGSIDSNDVAETGEPAHDAPPTPILPTKPNEPPKHHILAVRGNSSSVLTFTQP